MNGLHETPLSPRQIRLALASIGITEAMVDTALENDPLAMIEWKHASQFERDHMLIDALAPTFDLEPEHVDALWAWATDL